MTWCEATGVDYVFGLARNERLVGAIAHDLWPRSTQLGYEVRFMPRSTSAFTSRPTSTMLGTPTCCEAVQRPGMRFVPVKNARQQSLLMLHRIRDHWSPSGSY
jgi:transposase